MNRNFNYFYREFRKYFFRLIENIDNDIEKAKKFVIAQTLVNKIFFIYFLCSKNAIKIDGISITGKKFFSDEFMNSGSFIENLNKFYSLFEDLEKCEIKINDHDVTCLFFKIDLFIIKSTEENLNIKMKKEDWSEIFNFLGLFKWIIDDDGKKVNFLNESGKIITPDILGYLPERFASEFEKKSRGIYYTPHPISEYISKRTIYSFILNDLDVKGDNVFRIREILENDSNESYLHKKLKNLHEIKIMDPSCGTGTFLMEVAIVVFDLISVINSRLKIIEDPYDIKHLILINNLYGVDISPSAIEISRLRLWLWIISSYSKDEKVRVLPNNEFNIMIGNALVGWNDEKLIYGTSINLNRLSKTNIERITKNATLEITSKILGIIANLENQRFTSQLRAYHELKKIYMDGSIENAIPLKHVLMEVREYFIEVLNNNLVRIFSNDKNPVSGVENIINYHPFHWMLDFTSIMQDGGFDIIISNPPYLFTRGMKFGKFEQKFFYQKYLKENETLTKGKARQSGKLNIFCLFLVRSLELLKIGGNTGFIIPNTFLRTSTNDIVRQYILDHSYIEEITDLGGGIFKGVVASAIIMILRKINNIGSEKSTIKYDVKDLLKAQYLTHEIDQERFRDNVICCYNIHVNEQFKKVFDKMTMKTIDLGDISSEIIEGLVTRKNDALFTKDSTIPGAQKLIRGKNIDRYKINWPDGQYIIYDPSRLHRARARHIHSSAEKLVIQRIGGGTYPLRAAYDGEQYYIFASINGIILENASKIENFTSNYKYILAILNSTLINGFYLLNYSNRSDFTVNITKTFIEKIPIKKVQEDIKKKISFIVDYIIYLNKFHPNEKKMNEFYDRWILDSLIYEIYFRSDLDSNLIDVLSPNFTKVDPLIKNPESLKIIKNIYKNINNDKNIQQQVRKITNHPIALMFKNLFQSRSVMSQLNI